MRVLGTVPTGLCDSSPYQVAEGGGSTAYPVSLLNALWCLDFMTLLATASSGTG